MQPEPGTMVTPNVRLLRPLRSGGMGTVWVAEHLTLETEVAVKFISADLINKGGAALERFRREAKAAAQLRSPHVVKLLDHGIVVDDALPYIVMELLEGETLQDRIARAGRLDVAVVAAIVSQVCKALGEAHRRGTVHRDIKPSNLFLTRMEDELFVKVLDFGIAKAGEQSDTDVTSTGVMIGTLHYMSPEQMKDARGATSSSDLWSLAVVAYFALTGERPFEATTPVALWQQMTAESFVLPSERVEVAEDVDDWFRRALAADPHDRFASAKEMARTFPGRASSLELSDPDPALDDGAAPSDGDADLGTQEYLARQALDVPSDERPAETSGDSQEVDESSANSTAPPPRSTTKRRRSLAQGFLLGVASLAILAGVIYFATRDAGAPMVEPTASARASTSPRSSALPSAPAAPSETPSAATTSAPSAKAAPSRAAPTRKHWPIGCTAERRPCGMGCCMWDHGCEPIGCTTPLPAGAQWDVRLAVVGIYPNGQPASTKPLRKAELWLRAGKEGSRQPVFPDQPLRLSTEDLQQPLSTWVQPNVDGLPEVVDLPPRGTPTPTGKILCRGLILQADRAGMTYQIWLSVTPADQPPPELCTKAQP